LIRILKDMLTKDVDLGPVAQLGFLTCVLLRAKTLEKALRMKEVKKP